VSTPKMRLSPSKQKLILILSRSRGRGRRISEGGKGVWGKKPAPRKKIGDRKCENKRGDWGSQMKIFDCPGTRQREGLATLKDQGKQIARRPMGEKVGLRHQGKGIYGRKGGPTGRRGLLCRRDQSCVSEEVGDYDQGGNRKGDKELGGLGRLYGASCCLKFFSTAISN